ncbi:MAG: TIGR04282 family arsenosugar biosynthesis glycosyltransferase [Pseudomonadota bacterium]
MSGYGRTQEGSKTSNSSGEDPVSDRIIVFTRYPVPGKTKTRLISVLGVRGAAELQRCMTEDTIKWVLQLREYRPVSVEIRYEGGRKDLMEGWLGMNMSYRHQGRGDLGQRMSRAFEEAFQSGMKFVVILGTDCPDLPRGIVETAFRALRQSDVVLGPVIDGGYYLIGFRNDTFLPKAFEGIHWGSDTVFQETFDILEKAGCSINLLLEWWDVDTLADVKELFYRNQETHFRSSKTIASLEKYGNILK